MESMNISAHKVAIGIALVVGLIVGGLIGAGLARSGDFHDRDREYFRGRGREMMFPRGTSSSAEGSRGEVIDDTRVDQNTASAPTPAPTPAPNPAPLSPAPAAIPAQ